jgi:hypothetical protein
MIQVGPSSDPTISAQRQKPAWSIADLLKSQDLMNSSQDLISRLRSRLDSRDTNSILTSLTISHSPLQVGPERLTIVRPRFTIGLKPFGFGISRTTATPNGP